MIAYLPYIIASFAGAFALASLRADLSRLPAISRQLRASLEN